MRAGWLLWGWLAVAPAWADDLAEMNAVNKVWDRYAEASRDKQPDAVDLLARSTLAHFGFLRDAALYASTDQLRRIPSVDRANVYLLRASQTTAQLQAMDERAIVRLCLEHGWISVAMQGSKELPTLSHITVMDDVAVAEAAPPTETQYQFGPDFVREGGAWKYRYESLIPDSSRMLDQSVQAARVPSAQVYERILATLLQTDSPPSLAALDRPMLDDAAARVRLNEQWPDYEAVDGHRYAAVARKAEDGDSFAQMAYGAVQLTGAAVKWVPKDVAGGMRLLEQSSDAGNAQAAQYAMAYLLSEPTLLDEAGQRRLARHAQRAADGGNPDAMEVLGTLYFSGAGGLQRDCLRAAEWQARAEEAGSTTARNELVWTWATCPVAGQRDPAKAMALAEHMLKQQDTLAASSLDTVAAALAASGRFEEAVRVQQEAIDKLKVDPVLGSRSAFHRKQMQSRLAAYKKGKDYVQNDNIFVDIQAGRY